MSSNDEPHHGDERAADRPVYRVDAVRLLRILLFGAVLPILLLIVLDVYSGLLPLLTILGLFIFIPAGSFFIIRAALEEFSKVVADVAPPDDEDDDARSIGANDEGAASREAGPDQVSTSKTALCAPSADVQAI